MTNTNFIQENRNICKNEVILADDLTGAMDAGIQLSKYNMDVNVRIVGMSEHSNNRTGDILLLDSESRNLQPDVAYSTVVELLNYIKVLNREIIYKKIDSTLRGNVGIELKAILNSGLFDLIVFAPSLPHNGRTVVKGYHYLNGRLLSESDLAKDPFSPVKSSYIPELISFQTNVRTALINIDEIRKGEEFVFSRLEYLHNEGARIIVTDAETIEDLEIIAQAIDKSEIRILPCGSAGLLPHLKILKDQKVDNIYLKDEDDVHVLNKDNGNKPLLTICGSPAKASKEQIRSANSSGIEILRYNSSIEQNGHEFNILMKKAIMILNSGKNLIIDGSGEGKNEIAMFYKDDIEGLNEDSKKIQEALASIVTEVVQHTLLSGIMIIGGDTAAAVCRGLGADSIKIVGEVEPFVPLGLLSGGNFEGLKVVTKAGGFGSKNVIINTVANLKGVKS